MKKIGGYSLVALVAIASIVALSYESIDSGAAFSAAPTPTSKSVEIGRSVSLSFGEYNGKPIVKSESEWEKILTAEEFYILRKEGTERAYTGALTDNKKKGTYHCAACGLALFSSVAKYDSKTGWPSFFEPIFKKNVIEKKDNLLAEERIEVECARCGSHLGHVFDDGPDPTGLRYCINSVALRFSPTK